MTLAVTDPFAGPGWLKATITTTATSPFMLQVQGNATTYPIDYHFFLKQGGSVTQVDYEAVSPSDYRVIIKGPSLAPVEINDSYGYSPGWTGAQLCLNSPSYFCGGACVGNACTISFSGTLEILEYSAGALTDSSAQIFTSVGTTVTSTTTGTQTYLLTEHDFEQGTVVHAEASVGGPTFPIIAPIPVGARYDSGNFQHVSTTNGFVGFCTAGGDVVGSGPFTYTNPKGFTGSCINGAGTLFNGGAGTYTFAIGPTLQAGIAPGLEITGADTTV